MCQNRWDYNAQFISAGALKRKSQMVLSSWLLLSKLFECTMLFIVRQAVPLPSLFWLYTVSWIRHNSTIQLVLIGLPIHCYFLLSTLLTKYWLLEKGAGYCWMTNKINPALYNNIFQILILIRVTKCYTQLTDPTLY